MKTQLIILSLILLFGCTINKTTIVIRDKPYIVFGDTIIIKESGEYKWTHEGIDPYYNEDKKFYKNVIIGDDTILMSIPKMKPLIYRDNMLPKGFHNHLDSVIRSGKMNFNN